MPRRVDTFVLPTVVDAAARVRVRRCTGGRRRSGRVGCGVGRRVVAERRELLGPVLPVGVQGAEPRPQDARLPGGGTRRCPSFSCDSPPEPDALRGIARVSVVPQPGTDASLNAGRPFARHASSPSISRSHARRRAAAPGITFEPAGYVSPRARLDVATRHEHVVSALFSWSGVERRQLRRRDGVLDGSERLRRTRRRLRAAT